MIMRASDWFPPFCKREVCQVLMQISNKYSIWGFELCTNFQVPTYFINFGAFLFIIQGQGTPLCPFITQKKKKNGRGLWAVMGIGINMGFLGFLSKGLNFCSNEFYAHKYIESGSFHRKVAPLICRYDLGMHILGFLKWAMPMNAILLPKELWNGHGQRWVAPPPILLVLLIMLLCFHTVMQDI